MLCSWRDLGRTHDKASTRRPATMRLHYSSSPCGLVCVPRGEAAADWPSSRPFWGKAATRCVFAQSTAMARYATLSKRIYNFTSKCVVYTTCLCSSKATAGQRKRGPELHKCTLPMPTRSRKHTDTTRPDTDVPSAVCPYPRRPAAKCLRPRSD